MIQKLEEEMKKIKLQLEKDILSEQQRANDAEHKASLVAKAEEKRVTDLGRYNGRIKNFQRLVCFIQIIINNS